MALASQGLSSRNLLQKRGRASPRLQVCCSAHLQAAPAPVAPTRRLCSASLKEWAVTVGALGTGDQTVLFRKGGIREPTFKPESSEFILFPTSFHTDAQLLKEGIAEKFEKEMSMDPKKLAVLSLPYYAEVTGCWTTFDASVLTALDELHVWTPAFMDVRLKWRAKQPITVLETRVWKLAQPLQVPVKEDYFGCFSWVDLSEPVTASQQSLQGATPVLTNAKFKQKQVILRSKLAGIEHEVLQL